MKFRYTLGCLDRSSFTALIHINRAEHNVIVFVSCSHWLKYWLKITAGTTPLSPKINNNTTVFLENFLECCHTFHLIYLTMLWLWNCCLSTTHTAELLHHSLQLSTIRHRSIITHLLSKSLYLSRIWHLSISTTHLLHKSLHFCSIHATRILRCTGLLRHTRLWGIKVLNWIYKFTSVIKHSIWLLHKILLHLLDHRGEWLAHRCS